MRRKIFNKTENKKDSKNNKNYNKNYSIIEVMPKKYGIKTVFFTNDA